MLTSLADGKSTISDKLFQNIIPKIYNNKLLFQQPIGG